MTTPLETDLGINANVLSAECEIELMDTSNLKRMIFDIHKTLVDDYGFPRERIWKLLMESGARVSMPEYYRYYDDITRELFDWSNIDEFIKVRDIHKQRLLSFYEKYDVERNVERDLDYLLRSMKECRIYEEVPRVMEVLKSKYQIGLLTNADNDDPLIEILLKSNLKFDLVITSESLRTYKPNPVVFQKILSQMKLQKHEVILVGDSQISDVLGGKRFGIRVVWVNRTSDTLREDIPQPDYEISNLSELPCLIGS